MPAPLRDEIKQSKGFTSLGEEAHLTLIRTADLISHEVTSLLKEAADVSPVQYNVLRILRGAGEAGHTCSAIAERLITRDPDVTRIIDRMLKRGLVQRSRDPNDRRVVRVVLTDAGRSLVDQLDEPIRSHHRKRFKGVSKERLRALIDVLDEIRG